VTLIQRDAPFPHWEFTSPDGDQLRVVPERGGLVCGWRCGGSERLYFDAERFADPSKSVRGGIPVLFPVCGNLPDNRLELPQGTVELAQHGFARDRPWQLQALADGRGIRLELCDDAITRASYPFAFRLVLEVRLEPAALAIRALVRHEAEDAPGSAVAGAVSAAMPFALGLHPYFGVADLGGAALEGLPDRCFDHLTAGPADTAAQLARLPQGVDLRVERSGAAPRLLTGLSSPDGSPAAAVIELQADSPFDHTVVWTDPPRPMVCLEPWTARRGELGLVLAAGEQLELNCRYTLVPD
jgi:galactose mutarotase-like enzyme